MPFTIYRVHADNVEQFGPILGPGFVTKSYAEAVAKTANWREKRADLENVRIIIKRCG